MMRQGPRLMLDAEPDIEVVAEADAGDAAAQLVPAVSPDVVLMDCVMPGLDGLAATERIHTMYPSMGIIVVAADEHEVTVAGAVRAGHRLCEQVGVISQ